MAVALNRSLAEWFAGPTPTNAAGEDMCLVAIVAPDTIASNFHYLASTGEVLTANTWNVHVSSLRNATSVLYGTVQNNLASASSVITFDAYQLLVVQIRSAVHEIWLCTVNGTPSRIANASVAGMGAFAFGSMDIGRRKVSPTDRYFGGDIELFGYFPGQSLSSAEIRKISAGQPVSNFLDMVPGAFYYNPTGTPGDAVTSLVDLSGNALNATLGNGAPVYSAAPTYPTRVYSLTVNSNGGASTVTGQSIQNIDDVQVSGSVIVASTNTAASSYGVWVTAASTTLTANDPVIDGLTVEFNCPAGHGLRIGDFNGQPISGGVVRNSSLSGQVYASNTPHLLTLSTNTDIEVHSCEFEGSFVQILVSNTDDCDVHDTIHRNPSGPAIYFKGVVDAHVTRPVVVCDGSVTQRENGLIAAVEIPPADGSIDCLAGTITDAIVVVSDISKIEALAQIGGLVGNYSVLQPVDFVNCTFVIADTVNIASTDLFILGGAIGTSANSTWAEWIASPNVINNRIIQYPQATVDYLAANPEIVRTYINAALGTGGMFRSPFSSIFA